MGRYGATANSISPRAMTRMIGAIPEGAREIRARSGVASVSSAVQVESLDPDDIAPFVVYLASDYAANVNGHIFLVHGGDVSLMSQPRPLRSIYNDGQWPVDELAPLAKDYLTKDIPNPAPPQPPRQ